MMSLPSDPAPVSTSALAQHRYNEALELEKQLRVLLQQRGPFDTNVRAVRNNIRENYEAVILEDHEFAESHDVEQSIWRLHYKQIDEFRAKIKKTNATAAVAAADPVISMPGAKIVSRREPIHKIVAVFKSFLAEATGFYHNLILKLRAKHGLPQDYSAFEGIEAGVSAGNEKQRAAEVKRCQLSCHRSLIFLGDLARYKEVHGGSQETRCFDWSVSAGYYVQAASLWPSSGNPHNQLAVLATYVGDELLAVYRYFRSLAVGTPFLTARDNLILLFEKNRQHYNQLNAAKSEILVTVLPAGGPSSNENEQVGDHVFPSGDRTLKFAVQDRTVENVDVYANVASRAELRKSFGVSFVRMNGILFTRTSLETFSEVYTATVHELEQLLAGEDSVLEAGLGADHRSGIGMDITGASGVLQLVTILMFTVHNLSWGSDNAHHPTYAEILQCSAIFQHAFTAAFECAGRLMRRCGKSKVPAQSSLLPAMLMFMEWLACRPEMAVGCEVNEKQAMARTFFWRQALNLLNIFADSSNEGNRDAGLDGALTLGSIGGFVEDDNEGGVALWEDYELRGFVPLVPAQTALDYSKRPPRIGMGNKKERRVRIQRLVAAGRAIANALESTGRGICYDEESENFIMAGEARSEKTEGKDVLADLGDMIDMTEEEECTELDDDAEALLSSISTNGSPWTLEASAHEGPTPFVKVTHGEEEDEEVIVFKPMIKERQAHEPLAAEPRVAYKTAPSPVLSSDVFMQSTPVLKNGYGNPWVSEVSREALSVPHLNYQGINQPTKGPLNIASGDGSYLLDANTVMASSKTGPVELAIPAPWRATSGNRNGAGASSASISSRSSMSLSTMSTPGVSTPLKAAATSGCYGRPMVTSTPSSAGKWLNLVFDTSAPAYTSSSLSDWVQGGGTVFANGPDKVSPGTGVIGRSKQNASTTSLWSSQPEALATNRSPSLRLGALTLTDNPCADTNPVLTTGQFSSAAESSTFPLSAHNPSASNGVVTPAISSGWSGRENPGPNKVGPLAMRPPPGFGPLPAKLSVSASLATPQGLIRAHAANQVVHHPSEGDDQVDDYGWLDDYKSSMPVVSHGSLAGQGGSSLYSSSYGMWSMGNGTVTSSGSEITPFPFPGMGASHHLTANSNPPPQSQPQPPTSYMETEQKYDSHRQKQMYEVQAQAQAQLHQRQHQHLLILQRQQQQQQQQWTEQYNSQDPFVS